MTEPLGTVVLETAVNLRDCMTKGSTFDVNCSFQDYFEEHLVSNNDNKSQNPEILGEPIASFENFSKQLIPVDEAGFVRKVIIETGGGSPLHEGCTVSVLFNGYWENEPKPFEATAIKNPVEVDLNDNGLLPGLQIAIKSMLVGEVSAFILAYQVMYGVMGNPPKIKPKSDCLYYVKVIRSIFTMENSAQNYTNAKIFKTIHLESKALYLAGVQTYANNNYSATVSAYQKAVNMLHKCRLANEEEAQKQEKMLIKLYTGLAVCYNKLKLPRKACIACNEVNRLTTIWQQPRVLFQNAKALRVIGDLERAEKKLRRAMALSPGNKEMAVEMHLLKENQLLLGQIQQPVKDDSNVKDQN